jgi:hypothetical protein
MTEAQIENPLGNSDIQPKTHKPIGDYAGTGAMVSMFLAAGYTMLYVCSTAVGDYGSWNVFPSVFGFEYHLFGIGPEILTVVLTRFLVTFGLLWLPTTWLIMLRSDK